MKYQFNTAEDLLKLTQKYSLPISEIAKLYEAERAKKSPSSIRNKMKLTRNIMYDAVKKGISSQKKSIAGISGGDAFKLYSSLKNMRKMMGNKVTVRAMAYALAVCEQNAQMGRIVAFPTAGGSGVIPGVLFSCSEHFKAGKRKLLRGMFTAAAFPPGCERTPQHSILALSSALPQTTTHRRRCPSSPATRQARCPLAMAYLKSALPSSRPPRCR